MNVVKFFSIESLIFGFLASIYFIIGTLGQTEKDIQKKSGMYCGGNKYLKKSFIQERYEYLFGSIFLCLSFTLQIINEIIVTENVISLILSLPLFCLSILIFPLSFLHIKRKKIEMTQET